VFCLYWVFRNLVQICQCCLSQKTVMAVHVHCQGEIIKFLTNALQEFFFITAINLTAFLWVVYSFLMYVELSQKGCPEKIKRNGNMPS
jgi:hypothetical protein